MKFRSKELIEANPFLKDGVKEGALIEIPKASFSESTQLFMANILKKRTQCGNDIYHLHQEKELLILRMIKHWKLLQIFI
ncbi:MAG: hypothetical protein R2821_06650 [Flavobacteriaceae bacterium]